MIAAVIMMIFSLVPEGGKAKQSLLSVLQALPMDAEQDCMSLLEVIQGIFSEAITHLNPSPRLDQELLTRLVKLQRGHHQPGDELGARGEFQLWE